MNVVTVICMFWVICMLFIVLCCAAYIILARHDSNFREQARTFGLMIVLCCAVSIVLLIVGEL